MSFPSKVPKTVFMLMLFVWQNVFDFYVLFNFLKLNFGVNVSVNSLFGSPIRHHLDITLASRQKGIECVHNSFDRIHRYVTDQPMPLWHHEEFSGFNAYKNAFVKTLEIAGVNSNLIKCLLEEAIEASNDENETYEVFKKYLDIKDINKLDGLQLQFVLEQDRELAGTEWDIFCSDFETLSKRYKKDPDFINQRYLVVTFENNLKNELEATRRAIRLAVREALPEELDPGEPRELAAVRARQGNFVFLSPKSDVSKIIAILERTPLFAAGNLTKQFENGWGDGEPFSRHATVIVGTHSNKFVVCDPLRPDQLRFEDCDEFLERTDKLYYYKG